MLAFTFHKPLCQKSFRWRISTLKVYQVKSNKCLNSNTYLSICWARYERQSQGNIPAWPVDVVPGVAHQWSWHNISFQSCNPASSDTEHHFCLSFLLVLLWLYVGLSWLLASLFCIESPFYSFHHCQGFCFPHCICASFLYVCLQDRHFWNTMWQQTLRFERDFLPALKEKLVPEKTPGFSTNWDN